MTDLKTTWRPGEKYTADAANQVAANVNANTTKLDALVDEVVEPTQVGRDLLAAATDAAAREAIDTLSTTETTGRAIAFAIALG